MGDRLFKLFGKNTISNINNEYINEENLHELIITKINEISEIDKEIQKLTNRAKEAKETALAASQKETGWSLTGRKNEDAIKALQIATKNQADALSVLADITKQLFEHQRRMARSMQYLFGLGVTNMATNRIVVKQLASKLKEASKRKLSALMIKEIEDLLEQLKAQQDIFNKLENHTLRLKEHNTRIQNIENIEKQRKDIFDRLDNRDEQAKEHIAIIQSSEKFSNEELSRRSFLDSKIYKVTIGLVAIIALVFSILNILL